MTVGAGWYGCRVWFTRSSWTRQHSSG